MITDKIRKKDLRYICSTWFATDFLVLHLLLPDTTVVLSPFSFSFMEFLHFCAVLCFVFFASKLRLQKTRDVLASCAGCVVLSCTEEVNAACSSVLPATIPLVFFLLDWRLEEILSVAAICELSSVNSSYWAKNVSPIQELNAVLCMQRCCSFLQVSTWCLRRDLRWALLTDSPDLEYLGMTATELAYRCGDDI